MSVTPYIVNGQEYAVKIPVNIVESSKEKRDKEKSACENEIVFTRTFLPGFIFQKQWMLQLPEQVRVCGYCGTHRIPWQVRLQRREDLRLDPHTTHP